MWRLKYGCAFLALFLLFATVKGSCLEYGHSCWGGHGKRSDGKVQRVGSNLPSNILEYLVEGSKKQTLLNALNNLNRVDENDADVAESRLETTPTNGEAVKYNEPLRKRRFKLYHHQPQQQQKQQQQQQQQQQPQEEEEDERGTNRNIFSMDDSAERWRKLPLHKYKYSPPELEQLGGGGAGGAGGGSAPVDDNVYYELK